MVNKIMETNAPSNHNAHATDGRHHHRHHSSVHHNQSKILSSNGKRSDGRIKSESHSTSSVKLPPPANEGELNLRHYFHTLGLPLGLLPSILKVYHSMESRIWVIENSLEMMHKDSHLLSTVGNFDKIEKEDGASRWSEVQQCVDFHMKMAARCWIPTKVCQSLIDFFSTCEFVKANLYS